ncbi:hypothetical protein WICMUC_003754 [Wickerhamomyces mucosus]|uniref:TUG ubiquitin-like domain-containing protein n=1 Tax=Wickerhamomyces mucosus TaxID=1378264 RepID=A0A9P8TC47_9ASCO|nr:hypothetical protein WICMUC_003754 [Wickerhamomyces mucosus]
MSSITILYELRSIKTKVSPSTAISDILSKAIVSFKLSGSNYALYYNDAILPLNLPFRLANLPHGGKLTLKAIDSVGDTEINLKIQLVNSPFEKSTIIKRINNNEKLSSLLRSIEKEVQNDIIGKFRVIVQNMVNVLDIDGELIGDQSLKDFGNDNNSVLRLTFLDYEKPDVIDDKETQEKNLNKLSNVVNPIPSKDSSAKIERGEDIENDIELENVDSNVDSNVNSVTELSSDQVMTPTIAVFKQSLKPNSSPLTHSIPAESTYNLTVPQLKQYQQMLSNKAHETLKQKQLKKLKIEENKQKIKQIFIRLKFDNLIIVEFNIDSHKTKSDLYAFIKNELLVNEHIRFNLYLPHPLQIISVNDDILVDTFDVRNLVLFKSEVEDVLKPKYLQNSKQLEELEDVKLDAQRQEWSDSEDDDTRKQIPKGELSRPPIISKNERILGEPPKDKESKLKSFLKLSKK